MDIKAEIERRLVERVAEELTAPDLEERFADMIDECYSFESVGGIFAHMSPSRVLKECDPVAWRCGIADMSAEEEYEEVGGEVYDRREVDALRETIEEEIDAENDDSGDA